MTVTVGIVGGTGLIGRAVVRQLRDGGATVRLYGRGADADADLDLDDPGSLAAADFGGLDGFVHCAGAIDEDYRAAPDRALRRCTSGMEALVRRLLDAGTRRIAYLSTAHVYGEMAGRITEATPALPVSNYAIGHFAAERVLSRMVAGAPGSAALILRPNAVYGPPGDRFGRWQLIPFAFPRAAVEEGVIRLGTPGLQDRNFVGTPTIGVLASDFLLAGDRSGVTILNPTGRVREPVIAFARRVARIAGEALGRDVTVEAPPPGPAAPPPIVYESDVMAEQPEPLPLDAYLRLAIDTLLENGRKRLGDS